jgi:poly(3-hydroxyalkanoate) synthetase
LQEGTIIKNNPFKGKDCFNCGEVGHISINCSNKKEDKYGKKKDKKNVHKKKKKYYKKKKNGQSYFVEWDSDASSHEDDDDKPSKGLAGVAIK